MDMGMNGYEQEFENQTEMVRVWAVKYLALAKAMCKIQEGIRDVNEWRKANPDVPWPFPDGLWPLNGDSDVSTGAPEPAQTGPNGGQQGRLQHRRKPKILIYEEILRERGRPMYITDILDAALARGVELNGKLAPQEQLRNALSSSKRVDNLGGNTWWLAGVPLPEGFADGSQNDNYSEAA